MAGDNSADCYCGDILKLLDLSKWFNFLLEVNIFV